MNSRRLIFLDPGIAPYHRRMTAKAPGATTCSSSGCGAASNKQVYLRAYDSVSEARALDRTLSRLTPPAGRRVLSARLAECPLRQLRLNCCIATISGRDAVSRTREKIAAASTAIGSRGSAAAYCIHVIGA
jgi:hypothetical protein